MPLEDILNAAKSLNLNETKLIENLQEIYAHSIQEGKFDDVETLQKFTGIKPSEEIYKPLVGFIMKLK